MLKQNIYKAWTTVQKKGIRSTVIKAYRYLEKKNEYKHYRFPDEQELEKQRTTTFEYTPKISILVPLYKTPIEFLKEMIDSVKHQTYTNWELCLADGTAVVSEITAYLQKETDERIKYRLLEKNGGISDNTNAALEMATGEYVALLDHDDVLVNAALFEVVAAINATGADALYTDEDKFDGDLHHLYMPHFKPDFNYVYFLSNNYICHFFAVKKDIAEEIGGFSSKYDGAQDYDFIMRCTEKAKQIYHIPKILYHWRCHENSTALNPVTKRYAYESGVQAVSDHFKRKGMNANVIMVTDTWGYYRSFLKKPQEDEITVVQVDKDEVSIINKKLRGVNTPYVLIASGLEKPLEKHEIEDLYGYLSLERVAAVSAKISWHDKIQYGGSIGGIRNSVVYAFAGKSIFEEGYFLRAVIPQETMIGCGSCIMIQTDILKKLNYFDETFSWNAAVADFSLRCHEDLGYSTVYDAFVHLKSKGKVVLFTSDEEKITFEKKWQALLQQPDRNYNINLSHAKNNYALQ